MELATVFKKIIIGLLALSLVFSCKKAEDRKCFKSSGEKTSITGYFGEFTKLRLEKKLNYVLVQDDSNYVKLTGGKNLLNFVNIVLSNDGSLEISNTNKCNFLRDMSQLIEVEIHFKELTYIDYIGSGKLTCKDTLHFDVFEIIFFDASGSYDLTVDANQFYTTVTDGMQDFTLRGKANYASLTIRGNAYGDASNLTVKDDLYVSNKSVGDVYVNADSCNFSGYIDGKGNVFYKGTPSSTNFELLNEGKFIPY